MRTNLLVFLALAASLVLAGCMHENGDDDARLVSVGPGVTFDPANMTVPAGTTVLWRNVDTQVHNVVADDGTWGMESNEFLQPGNEFRHTFTTPGSYAYHCSPHAFQDDDGNWQGMTATIVVE